MKTNGQAQPCLVRPISHSPVFDYELIVGERRWRAAKIAEIDLLVMVDNLTDGQAAAIQIAENSNRKDLSDFSKGMNYSRLIDNGILTQKDLEQVLGKNK